jgi:hypothetical protein
VIVHTTGVVVPEALVVDIVMTVPGSVMPAGVDIPPVDTVVPAAGDVMTRDGGVLAGVAIPAGTVTVYESFVTLPAGSVDVSVMTFCPTARVGTGHTKDPVGTIVHITVVVPEAFATVMVMVAVGSVIPAGPVDGTCVGVPTAVTPGSIMIIWGLVRSMYSGNIVLGELLPAASVDTTESGCIPGERVDVTIVHFPSVPTIPVPTTMPFSSRIVIVDPGSHIPVIVGVWSLVDPLDVTVGATGAMVSIVIGNSVFGDVVLLARSV